MQRILITGGCGFIGANLVRRLASRGDTLRVLDNLSTGNAADIDGFDVELVCGDIRDAQAVRRAVRGVDAVVHLAAQTGVIPSVRSPLLDFDVNARGTLDLLTACRDADVPAFIFASTGGAILGEKTPPVHEEMAPRPLSPYGASKLAAEGYCSAFHGAYGLRTIALRFSNVYGPFSYHKASVVAQFLKLLRNREPLTVYGDGTQTRDFLYAGDLVDAVAAALESPAGGEVFQIASGIETSVNQLIAFMGSVFPSLPFEVRRAPARAGEVTRNFASIGKARAMLNFEPRVGLPEGLAATWSWFSSRATQEVR